MNLRDLKYIVAVGEARHFGRAAERCFVSQPTLSGQIKKLEEELDVVIFERTKRSVEVTPVGEAIIAHARKLLEQADAIEQLASAYRDPLAGSLRVGAIPTLSPYLMPLILVPLKKNYPQMKLVLSEEITETLLRRLGKHEIDVALIATPVEQGDLQVVPLFDEPFWIAHPHGHVLYNKDDITSEDLRQLDLLLLADGHCLAQQAMEVCGLSERTGRGEMGDLRAASLETLLQLVGAGFGCTLVPALAIRGSWMTGSGVIARKLDLPDTFRRVSLVFRRSFPRRRPLEVFAEVILRSLPNTVRPASLMAVREKLWGEAALLR
ncbi:MAG: LysR family transcriptional regulator [Gammaproteobacteria bacterium]|nr:LysR family transcriptional regulator [Gammaproteobacteria bacterium]MBU1655589.1 LysR family transcriptional regulator [Gammaproteobacteria bacterium]MBU1961870.1 LysR family transcriptional regulator [Gammaproteobacteria bacterium]